MQVVLVGGGSVVTPLQKIQVKLPRRKSQTKKEFCSNATPKLDEKGHEENVKTGKTIIIIISMLYFCLPWDLDL